MLSHEATVLPDDVTAMLPHIVEAATQAAFKTIADLLAAEGFPVTGDFAPDELQTITEAFETFVRTMALNNNDIASMNDF